MKKFWMMSLAVILAFGFAACDRENVGGAPEVLPPDVLINYDGVNVTAPQLPAGTYEGGIRIPADIVNSYTGSTLKEVQFHIATLPSNCSIKIYQGSDQSAPDALIYSQNVTDDIEANAWNVHTLQRTVTLSDQDLWIAVQFSHPDEQQTLGCDPGPAVANGDWIRNSTGWQTLRQLNSAISINWNVRAVVTP
ncbi:MAG: hypothetical protein AAFR59_03450 [Bacteroidota bacterium]